MTTYKYGYHSIHKKKIALQSRKYFHKARIYNLKASKAIDRYEVLLRQTEEQLNRLHSLHSANNKNADNANEIKGYF